jgi:hypothetical protein
MIRPSAHRTTCPQRGLQRATMMGMLDEHMQSESTVDTAGEHSDANAKHLCR